MKRQYDMPFGARLEGEGARFALWAPSAQRVDLVLSAGPQQGIVSMQRSVGGWHHGVAERADTTTRYAFRIDDDLEVPDPASRSNPEDVHAPSALVDCASYQWKDGAWRGRPWHEAVVYELHIGCFTEPGTFSAAIDKLDALKALGVTAIELMPVADFPGRRGWGYDGVLLFAPDASYGTPDELKALVDAAHARDMMVLLDVVYNHFGPDGNYLHVYASPFFNAAVQTPWGAAINFDGEDSATVRSFFIHNALYWLQEFHVDGLRLDAVHAMHDTSPRHFVEELAQAVRSGPGRERHVHLILENDANQARFLERPSDANEPLQQATAQWNDDIHHAIHVLATGETDGYYADYAERPLWQLGRALAEGFVYQGDPSAFRGGEPRGEPSIGLPPLAFVDFTQTHDQVGNRAFGERLVALTDEARLRALTACVLLAPAVPMLFMGEEYGAASPFQYFCDFSGDLARAVTEGRRNEFGRFALFADPKQRDAIPDPNDPGTFMRSKLDWRQREHTRHATWLQLYRDLLRIRREELMPLLARAHSGSFHVLAPGRLAVHWPLGDDNALHLLANLADAPAMAAPVPPGKLLYASAPDSDELAPWSVRVSLERR